MAPDCSIVDLPSSALQQIFAALAGQPDSLPDLCCCLCVCKQWKEAASCKENWSVSMHCAPHRCPQADCHLATCRRHIDIPFSKADRLTSTHLEKLVSRSSDQVLSLKLPGCRKVRTYSIMQVLLHNQQLEEVLAVVSEWYVLEQLTWCAASNPAVLQVDLSYCYQVGVHNVEFFLHELSARPNPKLKHLTVDFRANGFWRLVRSCCGFCFGSYDLHMPHSPLAALCTMSW